MAATMRFMGDAPRGGCDGGAPSFARQSEKLAAFRVQFAADTESLCGLIESEIIPRLMIAHAAPLPEPTSLADERRIGPSEVKAFAPLVMQVEADAVLAYVETLLTRGVTVDAVMIDLLAPTARLLGELWEADRCDFVDVTMGLWRLQEVVHEIAGRHPPDRAQVVGGRRALFASMPGDQHNFGTVVIDELFRRDGWLTDRVSDAETADLMKRVAENWFDLVGLTISCDCNIASLTSIIVALRNVSRNPQLCIMVGGRVLSANPELAAQVGADGTARDAKVALKVAVDLVREREWESAAGS